MARRDPRDFRDLRRRVSFLFGKQSSSGIGRHRYLFSHESRLGTVACTAETDSTATLHNLCPGDGKEQSHRLVPEFEIWEPRPLRPQRAFQIVPATYPEIEEATEKYLVTNADAAQTAPFSDWTILSIKP